MPYNMRVYVQIVIAAGGGVCASNVAELIRTSGVREVHTTARVSLPGPMLFRRHPAVFMGGEKVCLCVPFMRGCMWLCVHRMRMHCM